MICFSLVVNSFHEMLFPDGEYFIFGIRPTFVPEFGLSVKPMVCIDRFLPATGQAAFHQQLQTLSEKEWRQSCRFVDRSRMLTYLMCHIRAPTILLRSSRSFVDAHVVSMT